MVEWWTVIATGPSLTRDDCDKLRDVGPCVAVNCGVFFAPWAKSVFATDAVWWRYYGPKISWFRGERVSRTYNQAGVKVWRGKNWKRTGGNSGHMAIQYAVDHGAKHIALLGFDQQKTGGKSHNHADHPSHLRSGARTNMANANGVAAWPRLMARTAEDLRAMGVTVVNLSRATALTCFPRMTVEQFLEDICQ